MSDMTEFLQKADWKTEKHVPVIEGTVMAVSMCNIHGLWMSSAVLKAA